jgi:hypothetical protein
MKTNANINSRDRWVSFIYSKLFDIAIFIKGQFLIFFAGNCPFFAVPNYIVCFHNQNLTNNYIGVK